MNQLQNAISLARVNNSGFPGWEISSLEPRQTPNTLQQDNDMKTSRITKIALIAIVIIGCLYAVFRFLNYHLDIDRCLDSGGVYDYENRKCLHKVKNE